MALERRHGVLEVRLTRLRRARTSQRGSLETMLRNQNQKACFLRMPPIHLCKATDSLDQGKDKIGGVAGEAQGAAGDLGGNAKNNLGRTQGVVKQGKDFVSQLTNGLSLDTIKGLVGKTVNDSGNIMDESGQVLGKASGDVSMMAGKTVNDSGEVIDSGKAVGRVSDVTGKVAKKEGQDIGTAINGFTPDTGGSGNVMLSAVSSAHIVS
jgi:hypothetical protein